MSKFYAAAFGAIALVATVGVDFANQYKAADEGLSLSGYTATISERFGGVVEEQALKKRQAVNPKTYLPDAPEGWTRREWTAVDQERDHWTNTQDIDENTEAMLANKQLQGLMAADKKMAVVKRKKDTWVYEKDGETVVLRVNFKKNTVPKGLSQNAMAYVAFNIGAMSFAKGFAMIQGVGFRETTSMDKAFDGTVRGTEARARNISAKIGNHVTIRAEGFASEASVLQLLKGVNYGALNAMLPRPVGGIGPDAPVLPRKTQIALVDAQIAVERLTAANRSARLSKNMVQSAERTSTLGGLLPSGKSVSALANGSKDPSQMTKREYKDHRKGLEMHAMEQGMSPERRRSFFEKNGMWTDEDEAAYQVAAEKEAKRAAANRDKVSINRLPTVNTRNRKASSCGGGSFCKVGN